MGVWLKSRNIEYSLRDGVGFGAKMKKVGPEVPVYFGNLAEEDFVHDSNLLVVHEQTARATIGVDSSHVEVPPPIEKQLDAVKKRGRPKRKLLSL